jgi:DNA-binding transcriptional LysR family regulator
MNYTLHQLTIFLKVVETQSITKTAEALHLSQPAVSIQLKNFQEQFYIPLVEIINKKVYITEFGLEIAESARTILNELSAIDQRLHKYKGLLAGTIKIASVSTGKYVIPYFLSEFLKKHENIELRLDVSNKTKVIEALEKNETDFALVSVLPEHLQLNKIELMPNLLFLVGNTDGFKEHASANKLVLESLPLIYREEGSATRNAMENFIEKNKIKVRKKIQLTSNEAVKQAIIAGIGYSIMPLIGIKNELKNKQLHIIPVNGLPLKSTWNIVWLKNKNLSPVAKSFVKKIESDKAKVIDKYFVTSIGK